MHYRMMVLSERLCCCMDVATGSLLTGIYTCFLSLAFIAIGIDSLVETSKEAHNSEDLVVLNAVYGLVIALSVLFGIASVSLVLGAAGKFKTYLILWIVVAPLWTVVAMAHLIVLPTNLSHAVRLTNLSSRICGTVFILVTNIFCMFCVCLFLATLTKSPIQKLRSLGVVEALESGFSSGYSRLRESIRPSKSRPAATFRNESSVANPVTLPEVSVSVVLDPNQLEVPRPLSNKKSAKPVNGNKQDERSADVGESFTQSLPSADQLGSQPQAGGFVNVAFASND